MSCRAKDSGLIYMLTTGDRGGMSLLYERYADILYYKISIVIADRDVANRVFEQTFASIWENYSSFNPATESFYEFIMRMALMQVRRNNGYRFYSEKEIFAFTESSLVELIYFGGYAKAQIIEEFSIAPEDLNAQLRRAVNKIRRENGATVAVTVPVI